MTRNRLDGRRAICSGRTLLAGLLVFGVGLVSVLAQAQNQAAQNPNDASQADDSTAIPIADVERDGPLNFEEDVLPIFQAKCVACHSEILAEANLDLETPVAIRRGGSRGASVIPGNADKSLLLQVAAHRIEPIMPPPDNAAGADPLTPGELGLLKRWIEEGAIGEVTGVPSPSQQAWRPLPPGVNPIYAVAVSSDGQFAAASRANQIFIYHVPSGQLVTRLTDPALLEEDGDDRPGAAHRDLVQSLAFNPEGDRLASGAFRTVKLWRRPRDVRLLTLWPGGEPDLKQQDVEAAEAPVGETAGSQRVIAVHPDGTLLAQGLPNGQIMLWSLPDGALVQSLEGHADAVTSLQFTRDGRRLLSASLDRALSIWDVERRGSGPAAGDAATTAEDAITDAAAEEQRPVVKLAGRIHTPTPIHALTVLRGELLTDPQMAGTPLRAADRFATGGPDNLIRTWRLPQRVGESVPGLPADATVLAVSPNRQFVAGGDVQGRVGVIDVGTGEAVSFWSAHDTPNETAEGPRGVTALSFDDSGDRLASGGSDGTIRVWTTVAANGKESAELVLRGPETAVRSVALRGDGLQVTAGYADGAVTAWNLQVSSARVLETAEDALQGTAGDGPRARVAAASTDGRLLASAGVVNGRPAIVVRDVESGDVRARFLGHGASITALAFSRDGRKLASGSADRTARIWSLQQENGQEEKFSEVATFSGHAEQISAVAFSSDGTQLATGSADGTVRLFSAAETTPPDSAELLHVVAHAESDAENHTVVGVAFSPDNTLLFSASADATVRFFSTEDGKQVQSIATESPVTAMAVRPDGVQFAIALADGSIRLYDRADAKLLHTLSGHAAPVGRLAFSPDGTRLVSGSLQGAAIVWNVETGRLLERYASASGTSVALFGESAAAVVLGDGAGQLTHHPVRFAQGMGDFSEPIIRVLYLTSNPALLFAATADGTIQRFNVTNGQADVTVSYGGAISELALSPDGQLLAVAGQDGVVKLFNAGNGQPQAPNRLEGFDGPVTCVTFSADGTRVIAGSQSGELLLFDRADGTLWERFLEHAGGEPGGADSRAVTAVVSAGPDGRRFISAAAPLAADAPAAADSGDVGGGPAVLSWQSLAVGRIEGHTAAVTALATVWGVEDQIISGSEDGTVRRWNVTNGQSLQQVNHQGPVTGVAVRPVPTDADPPVDQRFASVGQNNIVRLWASGGQQIAELQGDIREKSRVAKLEQEVALATARVASAQSVLEAAEEDAPLKATAAREAGEMLATSNADVEAKLKVFTTREEAKSAAEKVAIETAAAAQEAVRTQREVATELALARRGMERAQVRLQQLRARLEDASEDEELTTAVETAEKTVEDLVARVGTAETTLATATTAAEAAAQRANTAAEAATAAAAPYAQAAQELREARQRQRRSQQEAEVATAAHELADSLLAESRELIEAAQARLTRVEAELEAARESAQAAEQPVLSVAFSPDGSLLATGGAFPAIHTWDANTGAAVGSFRGHGGAIHSVAFTPDGNLASGSADQSVGVWLTNPGWVLERTIGNVNDPLTLVHRVGAIDFSPDGAQVAVASGMPTRGGQIHVFNVIDQESGPAGALLQSITDAHTDAIFDVAFSPDGDRIASAAADNHVRVFDVQSGQRVLQMEGHTNYALGVAWNSDGRLLASCGADNTIRTWDGTSGERVRVIQGFNKQVTSVTFVGETQITLSTSGDPIVRMHNTDNGGVIRNFTGPTDYVYSAAVTPDSRIVVAGGHESVLWIWNGTNAQLLHTLEPPRPPAADEADQD